MPTGLRGKAQMEFQFSFIKIGNLEGGKVQPASMRTHTQPNDIERNKTHERFSVLHSGGRVK